VGAVHTPHASILFPYTTLFRSKIDRAPRVASKARVEELGRIWEARPVGKGKLHLIFVGVADRDDSVARPHWASLPLPFLDYVPRSEEHTSELQSPYDLVCRLLL